MTYKNDRKWQAFFLTLAVKAKFFCILPFCDLFTVQSVQLVESSRCRIIHRVSNNSFSGERDVTYRKETAWQETVYSMINTTIYSMINTIIFSQWQDRLIQFIGHNGPLYSLHTHFPYNWQYTNIICVVPQGWDTVDHYGVRSLQSDVYTSHYGDRSLEQCTIVDMGTDLWSGLQKSRRGG